MKAFNQSAKELSESIDESIRLMKELEPKKVFIKSTPKIYGQTLKK